MENQSTCVRCGKPCAPGEIMCPECNQWFQEQTQGKNQNFKKVNRPAAKPVPPRQTQPAPQKAPAQPAQQKAPAQTAPSQAPANTAVGANQQICPNCGSVISSISRFCPRCNWDQNQTPAAPVEGGPVPQQAAETAPQPTPGNGAAGAPRPVSPKRSAPAKQKKSKLLIPIVAVVAAVAVIAVVLVLVLGGKDKSGGNVETDPGEEVSLREEETGETAPEPEQEPETPEFGTGTALPAANGAAGPQGVWTHNKGAYTLYFDGVDALVVTHGTEQYEGTYTIDGTTITIAAVDGSGSAWTDSGSIDSDGNLVFDNLDGYFTWTGEQLEVSPVVACIKCGAAIPADAQFCPYCGQDQTAPVESEETEEETEPVTATLIDYVPETGGLTAAELWVSGTNQSSVVTQSGNHNNTASVLVDGDLSTSWQEGVDGDGIDEWVSVDLTYPGYVTYLRLYLGNWRSEEWYEKNNVPKVLEISLDDQTFTVEFPYDRTEHWVEFSEPVLCNTVKLTVKEVYPGSQYDDTCIAEVMIYGYSE